MSKLAREFGFNRVTCCAWAHQAGVFSSSHADDRRQEFLRLRSGGLPRGQAARELGIDQHRASGWDQGIRQFSKGRVYPDGRVVLYNQDEILAAVRRPRRRWAHGDYVPVAALEKVLDARYLSLIERERIKDLVQQGMSIRQVAVAIGRAASTISRELRRNTVGAAGYLPHTAHRLSAKARTRPKVARLTTAGPLQDYVAGKLAKRWSPEQIAHRLGKERPQDRQMHVCTERIYQAIYVHSKG
ncbi:transposase [Kocuria sp. cx-455]|uniref:transposase n=1 Tax=Kocuria sp. cx-455 TaxID=2771377 RepID=UPI003FA5A761